MIFYSHAKDTDNGAREGSKLLRKHLVNVRKLVLNNLKTVNFSCANQQELKDLLTFSSIFHDLGKYSTYFQNYLLFSK